MSYIAHMLIINIYQTSGNVHNSGETVRFVKECLSLFMYSVDFPALMYNEMFTTEKHKPASPDFVPM